MLVCVVGASGVVGRSLVPLLSQRGHEVRALVRSPEKCRGLADAGAEVEAFDLLEVGAAERLPGLLSGCGAVVHAATAVPRDPSSPGAWDAETRLRTEGTRVLLEASLSAGAGAYLQQSIVPAYPDGGERWIDEDDPLDASPERAEVVAPERPKKSSPKANATEANTTPIVLMPKTFPVGSAKPEEPNPFPSQAAWVYYDPGGEGCICQADISAISRPTILWDANFAERRLHEVRRRGIRLSQVDKANRPDLSRPDLLGTDPKSHALASFGSPRNSKDRTARF